MLKGNDDDTDRIVSKGGKDSNRKESSRRVGHLDSP